MTEELTLQHFIVSNDLLCSILDDVDDHDIERYIIVQLAYLKKFEKKNYDAIMEAVEVLTDIIQSGNKGD